MPRAFVALLFALLGEAGMLDLFAWLSEAGYGGTRTLAEASELPLTYAGLVLGGPFALVAVAICIAVLCLPLRLASTLVTHVLVCVANAW